MTMPMLRMIPPWRKLRAPIDSPEKDQLILRRETYGGTLFHPRDATFVQLDHEAFECVRRVFGLGLKARGREEKALIESVKAALPGSGRVRVVSHVAPAAADRLKVLSAPSLVDFQITERCGLGCPQCYASSVVKGNDVSWDDAKLAVRQMREAGVCQVALGGGEPILHPRLADLLSLIRDSGMVPNMTTTGIGLTPALAKSMRENCGAIAMSLEGVDERFALRRKQGFPAFKRKVSEFLDLGIPLVLQVTVSNGNIQDLDSIVDYALGVKPLYGVVFLAHKPAGRARGFDGPLAGGPHSVVHSNVMRAIKRLHAHTRVGFDCCFTPALVGFEQELEFAPGTIVEGCSATRSGLGLTPTLDVLPCTFLIEKNLGNLRDRTLLEIWNDRPSAGFRNAMDVHASADSRCRSCSSNISCLGGCSAWALTSCVTKSPPALVEAGVSV